MLHSHTNYHVFSWVFKSLSPPEQGLVKKSLFPADITFGTVKQPNLNFDSESIQTIDMVQDLIWESLRIRAIHDAKSNQYLLIHDISKSKLQSALWWPS